MQCHDFTAPRSMARKHTITAPFYDAIKPGLLTNPPPDMAANIAASVSRGIVISFTSSENMTKSSYRTPNKTQVTRTP